MNRPPLVSVEEVKYIDTAQVMQTFPDTDYRVVTIDRPGYIELAVNKSYPALGGQYDSRRINAAFTGGYADRGEVPEPAKLAVKMLVDWWYSQRAPVLVGSISKELEFAYEYLIVALWTGVYP